MSLHHFLFGGVTGVCKHLRVDGSFCFYKDSPELRIGLRLLLSVYPPSSRMTNAMPPGSRPVPKAIIQVNQPASLQVVRIYTPDQSCDNDVLHSTLPLPNDSPYLTAHIDASFPPSRTLNLCSSACLVVAFSRGFK